METRIPLQLPFEFNRENISQFNLWLERFTHDQKIDWFFEILSNGAKHENLYKEIDNWAIMELDFWEVQLQEEGLMRETEKWVEFTETSVLVPTEKGRKVKASGGWIAYLDAQKQEEEQQSKLIASSLKINQSVKTTNYAQIANMIITLVVFMFTAWIAWKQYNRDQANDIDRELLQLRLQRIEQQLKESRTAQQQEPPFPMHPKPLKEKH